ncbi:PaaI family thioesterase [Actinoplanes sp. NPDC051851]|uniref:PaaI family thioesterase n=1 Tax=Actinoplanes sp. NPDC051851 TaxID=3154753 RepID=UPI0034165797
MIDDRRAAIEDLGDALRTLVETATTTEAPAAALIEAADRIRELTAPLAARTRDRDTLASADDLLGNVRMYNPVIGPGNPLAPPLRIVHDDGVAVGTCTLGLAFEGPPRFAHGGVSAMLLDQILGHAVTLSGHPGMTIRLDTAYRRPVPLLTPLRLTAEVTAVDGRLVTAAGSIAAASDPDTALVTATGTFKTLSPHQTSTLFGPLLRASPTL